MSTTEVTSDGWRLTRGQDTTQIDAPADWPGLVRGLVISNMYFDEIVCVLVDVFRLSPAGFRWLSDNPHRLTDQIIEYLKHRGFLG